MKTSGDERALFAIYRRRRKTADTDQVLVVQTMNPELMIRSLHIEADQKYLVYP